MAGPECDGERLVVTFAVPNCAEIWDTDEGYVIVFTRVSMGMMRMGLRISPAKNLKRRAWMHY